jgi:GT2 family glycosyltransferase
LAYKFQPGDSNELAQKLLEISSNRQELLDKKSKLRNVLLNEFTYEHTSKEFLKWLENPQRSPDCGKISPLVSRKTGIEQVMGPRPIQPSQKIITSGWSFVASFLKAVGLGRYEEKVKEAGSALLYNKTKDQVLEIHEKYRGEFLKVIVPEMKTDSFYLASTIVKNTGKETWKTPTTDLNPLNISYVWKKHDGKIVTREGKRTSLTRPVKPGNQLEIDVHIVTPKEPGDYVLELHLIKEHQFWLSEIGGDFKPFSAKVHLDKKESKTINQKLPPASVVVVTYNGEKYVAECIDALLGSEYSSLEIIVVDNASADGTIRNLKKYGRKITLIENDKNLGFSEGSNLGIKHAKGEIIILINQDAIVNKTSIKELVLPFLEDENIMITGSKILYPGTIKIQSAGGILQKNGLTNHIGYGEEDHNQYDYVREVDYVTGASMAVRRKLFEKTDLFSIIYKPAYFEELEKCLQAKKLNYKVVFVPQSVVYHHESTTFGALSKSFLKHYHTNRFRFIYRNYSFKDIISKFIPNELKWFFGSCSQNEWSLVVRAHVKAIFSYK